MKSYKKTYLPQKMTVFPFKKMGVPPFRIDHFVFKPEARWFSCSREAEGVGPASGQVTPNGGGEFSKGSGIPQNDI